MLHATYDDLVFQCGYAERSCPAIRFGYFDPPGWLRPIRSRVHRSVKVEQSLFQPVLVLSPRHPIHPRRSAFLQLEERPRQGIYRDMV